MILMTFHDFSLISMIFKRKLEEKREEEKRLQEEREKKLQEERESQEWLKAEAEAQAWQEGVRRTCTIS